MPKMKTNSGAKKRFTLTGTGKIKRKHAFKSHILTKKTTKQKRNLTHTGLVHKTDLTNVKEMLCLKQSFSIFNHIFLSQNQNAFSLKFAIKCDANIHKSFNYAKISKPRCFT